MKKILITAFENFGNHSENPSEILLSEIKISERIYCLLLPVTFRDSFHLLKSKLKKENYKIIIMLGFASERDFISFEKINKTTQNEYIEYLLSLV